MKWKENKKTGKT